MNLLCRIQGELALQPLPRNFLIRFAHAIGSGQLSAAQQEVFLQRFAEGKSYDDIAKDLAQQQIEEGVPTDDDIRKAKAAVLKRMGGVYDALAITGKHRGKEKLLWNKLYAYWHDKSFGETSFQENLGDNSVKLINSDVLLESSSLGDVLKAMQSLKERLIKGEELVTRIREEKAGKRGNENLVKLLEESLFDGAVSELIVLLHRAIGAIALQSTDDKLALITKIVNQVTLNIKPREDDSPKTSRGDSSVHPSVSEAKASETVVKNKGGLLTNLLAAEVAQRIGRRIIGFARQPKKLGDLIASLTKVWRKLNQLQKKIQNFSKLRPEDSQDHEYLERWQASEDLLLEGILTEFVHLLIEIIDALVTLGYRNHLEILRYSIDRLIIILRSV